MTSSENERTARFPVGLEEGPGGATHVHSFSIPGCVGTGSTRDEALDTFAATLSDWLNFLDEVGEIVPDPTAELEIAVEEWITTDAEVAEGESNVCFDADRQTLSDEELRGGVLLLGRLRGRILPYIRRAKDEELERYANAGLNARLVLDELARAQWWTLTRLGASPMAEVPDRVVARLDTAMALIVQNLGDIPESLREADIVLDGEEWTPRKVLRRLLWLEWTLGGHALDLIRLHRDD